MTTFDDWLDFAIQTLDLDEPDRRVAPPRVIGFINWFRSLALQAPRA